MAAPAAPARRGTPLLLVVVAVVLASTSALRGVSAACLPGGCNTAWPIGTVVASDEDANLQVFNSTLGPVDLVDLTKNCSGGSLLGVQFNLDTTKLYAVCIDSPAKVFILDATGTAHPILKTVVLCQDAGSELTFDPSGNWYATSGSGFCVYDKNDALLDASFAASATTGYVSYDCARKGLMFNQEGATQVFTTPGLGQPGAGTVSPFAQTPDLDGEGVLALLNGNALVAAVDSWYIVAPNATQATTPIAELNTDSGGITGSPSYDPTGKYAYLIDYDGDPRGAFYKVNATNLDIDLKIVSSAYALGITVRGGGTANFCPLAPPPSPGTPCTPGLQSPCCNSTTSTLNPSGSSCAWRLPAGAASNFTLPSGVFGKASEACKACGQSLVKGCSGVCSASGKCVLKPSPALVGKTKKSCCRLPASPFVYNNRGKTSKHNKDDDNCFCVKKKH